MSLSAWTAATRPLSGQGSKRSAKAKQRSASITIIRRAASAITITWIGGGGYRKLIYQLLQVMGTQPDAEIGEALFAAMTTDTGNFSIQYDETDLCDCRCAL